MAADKMTFLVGSGISKLSNAPMVDDLTKQVLESAYRPHTDWKFYPIPPSEGTISEGLAAQAQCLIRIVHEQIEGHIFCREERAANYEDYFSCLKQIVQDETGNIVNPLIAKNVESLRNASVSLYVDSIAHIDNNRFASLSERALDLIQCVVHHSLLRLKSPIGMSLFSEVSHEIGSVDIFSLNHDLLIEKHLKNDGIAFADGFSQADGDATVFNSSWEDSSCPVRLYKLHGSINWYHVRFKEREIDSYVRIIGDPDYAKDSSGKRLDCLSIAPSFLMGTSIKEQSYGHSLYGELFEKFRHRLRMSNALICSGYGWLDKGINIRINEWLLDRKENRVIILHGEDGEDLQNKRFWYSRWDDYKKTGKVLHVPIWFSECTINDLNRFL